jgi:mono/diheme cytochrome c family protein
MPVVALLPLWGFMYMEAMSPPKVEVLGPLAEGETLYNGKCASCHLANGAGDSAGGVGRQLNNGEVLKTFESLPEQVAFIRRGSYPVGTPYGNPNREGGQHIARGGMPAHPQSVLTNAELTAIVCHVRITLAGEDPATDASWCAEDASVVVDAADDGTIIDPEAPK